MRRVLKAVAREWETGTPQYYLQNFAWAMLLLYAIAVIGLCPLFAAGEMPFPASHENSYPTANTRFMLQVAEDGRTTFVKARGISEDLRKEIFGRSYPSPEAAEEAASSSIEERASPVWLQRFLRWLGPRPAYAHAVNVCTTATKYNAKVSNQTGYGRHISWRRFDRNGYRYTRTDHQVLSNWVWVSTDTFLYKINKRYC